jgi:hypothetical protein
VKNKKNVMEKNLNFNLQDIVVTFELSHNENCSHLAEWLAGTFELESSLLKMIDSLHENISSAGVYMNEEEIKAKIVGLVFFFADMEIPRKLMVFYERPLSGIIKDVPMSVICDCIVATPVINAPKNPYFFLQVERNRNPDEVGKFKKSKGEKKDPEAQMLVAMLLAQQKNNDQKPIYGSFLLGMNWYFTTLIDGDYCVSRAYDASNKEELIRIIYILKRLKELIINR